MGTSDFLRTAIVAVLGLRVKFIARVDAGRESSSDSAFAPPESWAVAAESAPATTPAAGSSLEGLDSGAAPSASDEQQDVASSPQDNAKAPVASTPVASTPVASIPVAIAPAATPVASAPAAPAAGASPVAASTSGWATVAIPGSTNGPAVPANDDIEVSASVAPTVSQSHAPVGQSATPSTQTAAPGAGHTAPPVESPPAVSSARAQHDDEPPFNDVPPPFDDAPGAFDDEAPPEMDAPAEERVANYAPQQPAPASLPVLPAERQHPNAPSPRTSSKGASRAPAFAEKQRYGEAVVREILGATFIEEQPYTAAPRTRNDY